MPTSPTSICGVARDVVAAGVVPLHALRHPPVEDTNGWYVWAGHADLEEEPPGFFRPLHAYHLDEMCPELLPFLALPPGWRVLLAPGYEDVWYDAQLLDV